jgi:hypothetical protein
MKFRDLVVEEEGKPEFAKEERIVLELRRALQNWYDQLVDMVFTDKYGNDYSYLRPETQSSVTPKNDKGEKYLNFNIKIGINYALSGDKIPDTLYYEPLKNFIILYNEFITENTEFDPKIFTTFLHADLTNIVLHRKGYSKKMYQSVSSFLQQGIPAYHTINNITQYSVNDIVRSLDKTIITGVLPKLVYSSEEEKERVRKRGMTIYKTLDKGVIPVFGNDKTLSYKTEYRLENPNIVVHSTIAKNREGDVVFGYPKCLISGDLVLPTSMSEMRANISERIRPAVVKLFGGFKITFMIQEVLYDSSLKVLRDK